MLKFLSNFVSIIAFFCLIALTYATYHNNNNIFSDLINSLLYHDTQESSHYINKSCHYNEVNLDIAMDVANVIYSDNKALVLTKIHHGIQEILFIDLCSGDVINKTKLMLKQEPDNKQHVYNEYTG